MTRILIADDHAVVRVGIRRLLESLPRLEVVAEAADGKAAVIMAIETEPNVIVLDYSLPLINGVEVTRQVRKRLPGTEVLLFTVHDSDDLISEALRAGARGFLLKSDASRDLIQAILCVAAHRPFFTGRVTDSLFQKFLKRPDTPNLVLTNRERVVVQLIAEEHTSKQIAQILHVSLKTVETHRRTVLMKLNLSSSAALVRYAVRNKLVEA
jgi:DNA-binding NarL/FixJ family response regulator